MMNHSTMNTPQPDVPNPQRDVVSDEQRSNRERIADDELVEHTKRRGKMSLTAKKETYEVSHGLKISIHGPIYQLKHLMLIMHRAQELKYSFRLATEMDAAVGFDDVVLRYTDSDGDVRDRFLRVKHIQNQKRGISAQDLSNTKNGDFSLLKYFISWRKIKENPMFAESRSKNFVLCTNIGLHEDDLKTINITVVEEPGTDNLLNLRNVTNKKKQPRCYKLSITDTSSIWKTLKSGFGGEVDDDEISRFLDEFILAVNLPNEKELGEIIERDIGDEFNRLDAGFVGDPFQIEILDWFKTKDGTFMTHVDADEFFNEMKGKLAAIKSMAVGLDHIGKLKELGIQFNSVNTKIRNFIKRLLDGSKQLLEIISPKQTLLTALQVYQTLGQRQKLYDNEIFTFVRLETLSREKISQLVLRAFEWSADQNLLIVDCESTSAKQHLQSLWNPICDIMAKNVNKKMILITQAREDLGSDCCLDRETCRVNNTGYSFENLTNESQKKLLAKRVTKFQGMNNSTNLAELLDIPDWDNLGEDDVKDLSNIMDTDSLVKLISEDELQIGCKLKGLEDVGEYYVNRTIFRHVVIKEDILTDTKEPDLLAISGLSGSIETCIQDELSRIGGPASRAQSRTNLTALARDREEEQFNDLCARNEHCNVHWLIKEQGQYIWKKSHGNITYLLQYRDDRKSIDINGETRAKHLKEDQLAAHHEPVIISNTAGMGKSTMLTYLASKIKENEPDMLVLKINLNHHSTALADVMKKPSYDLGTIDGAIQFLVKELSSGETNFSRKVYKRIIERNHKVALIFDGFDEISSTYERTVIDLLQTLVDYGIRKLLVATRPRTRGSLEGRLNAFSFEIRPFSTYDQERFLTSFWKTKFEDSHHNLDSTAELRIIKYAATIMKTLAYSIKDQKNKFTVNPLQAKLVADVFERHSGGVRENFDSCEDFIESEADEPKFPEKINIIYLYEHFVGKKFKIFFEKRGGNLLDPMVLAEKEQSRKSYTTKHETLALYTLFDKDKIKELQLSQRDSSYGSPDSTDLKDYIERDGIITEFIDGQPRFGHQTHAEYFAAKFFSKIVKRRKPNESFGKIFVAHVLLEDEYETVRAFINLLLTDEYRDVLEGEFWTRFVKEHRSQRGGTIFHSAAAEGNDHIVRIFLNCFGANNEDRKLIIHVKDFDSRTAVHRAVGYGHLDMIKLLTEDTDFEINCQDEIGQTPLHQAVLMGTLDVVRYFIDKGADVNLLTDYEETLLYIAARYGRSKMVKYLLEKGADVNLPTENGKTPLYTAARYGRSEMVQYLLEKGANVNFRTIRGCTLLHAAARGGIFNIKDYSLEIRDDVDLLTHDGETPLYIATQYGQSEMVKYLLEEGADVNLETNNRETPLYAAVQQGGSEMVKYLLEKGADVNLSTYNGETPLYIAAQYGRSEMVKYLLEKGADVNSPTKNGKTPLYTAARYGRSEMVKYLLEKGADANLPTNNGETPLYTAVQQGGWEMVKYLLEKGADVNLLTKNGKTPLYIAAQYGGSEMVKYLLEEGADVNLPTYNGETPLYTAVQWYRSEMVKYLLEKGADVNLPTNNGETPLYTAVQQGGWEMIKYLLEKGADVNLLTKNGKTPLYTAARYGRSEMVEYLLEKGADVNLPINNGETPLYTAVQWYRSEMVKYLLEKGADVNLPTNNGETPLYTAVQQGGSEMVKYLLEKGADANLPTNNGETPLYTAVQQGGSEMVKYLLEKGADVNLPTKNGKTPSYIAAQYGRSEMVKYLLEKGADVNLPTKNGKTPLYTAARYGRSEMVKYLLEKGANVNFRTNHGCTLLHAAARGGVINIVDCFTEIEANVNLQTNDGATPLYIAAQYGRSEMVEYLLEKGADVHLPTNNGETPLFTATRYGRLKMIKYLLEKGVDINSQSHKG